MFDVGDGTPEFLPGEFVVGVGDVDFVDQMFEVAGVLVEEMRFDAVGEDLGVVGNIFALDDAFDAVGGAGAEEVEAAGFEELDGGDFYGEEKKLWRLKTGF